MGCYVHTIKPTQIKQARLTAGLSIVSMAKIMGCSRQTVHNWESGKHPMLARDFEYMEMKLALRVRYVYADF